MMCSMKSMIVIPLGMYLRLIDSRTLSSSIFISSRRCSFARSASMIFHFTFGSAVVISLLSIHLEFIMFKNLFAVDCQPLSGKDTFASFNLFLQITPYPSSIPRHELHARQ